MKVLREMKSKPRFKDKMGNNVKQHFGIYKYFINTTNQDKEKFYISYTCRKISMRDAIKLNKEEQDNIDRYGKYYYYEWIQKVGVITKDKSRLEFYGLPEGLCE